ncbi:MAG TPA: hypothetical protein VLF62_02625 [Candidatus Saccharimonadales bacterium]|nr:hypothetical protein [Candidatus Saccharimonadales bacterium]
MPIQEQFIKAVGKMPFTAKHSARWCYTEATRAALRGDEPYRRYFANRLGQIALCNDVMLLCGAGITYLSAKYGVEHHNPAFVVEATGATLYAIGHGASGLAQHLMVRRHRAQAAVIAARRESAPPTLEPLPAPMQEAVQPEPPPALPYATQKPTSATFTERVVTNSGTAALFVPLAHMTVNDVILPFIQR